MDYFNSGSTEDYVAASFTSTECGKKMVKRVSDLGRPMKRPLELSEAQADKLQKTSRWHLYLLIAQSTQVPSQVDASVTRNKSSALFCMQAQQYYSALTNVTIGGWSIYALTHVH